MAKEVDVRFENLLNNVECGIAIYHITEEIPFSIVYLNEGFCQMFGAAREELIQELENDYASCVAEQYKENVIAAFRYACKTIEPTEVTYWAINHKGMELWVA